MASEYHTELLAWYHIDKGLKVSVLHTAVDSGTGSAVTALSKLNSYCNCGFGMPEYIAILGS